MSRFWGGDDSDSNSDSESDSGSESDTEKKDDNKRVWDIESDSDSDDDVREVKSAKDRAFEDLKKLVDATRNKIKTGDWSGIQSSA
jgi:hypothetical protein